MSLSVFLLIVFGFLFSALFSGVETGSYMVNRIRLRRREQERDSAALRLSGVLNQSHLFIYTVLIGNNIAVYVVSGAVTDLYLNSGISAGEKILGFLPWNAETAATLTLMFPLFLLAEVGPKNLFRKKAELLMYRFSGLMRLLLFLFYPFTWPLNQLFNLLTRGMDRESSTETHRLSPDGLKDYFSAGERDGVITPDQTRMVDNATSMHRVPVRTVMTPFRKVPRLPAQATVADFKRLLAKRNTEYAVLVERHRIVGVVTLFTIVNRRLGSNEELRAYAETLPELHENRNLKSAFYRLRRHPRHCAVVHDAHKHPVGLVQLDAIARYIAGH